MWRPAAAGARSSSSPATASNFGNPSVYRRCGSPRSNWLENSYPRTLWKLGTMLTLCLDPTGRRDSRSESSILPVQFTHRYRKGLLISASTVISEAPVLVSGFEVSRRPHLHIPHMAEKWAGG